MAKTDRTARLLKVEHILYQNSEGIKAQDIARLCDVSERTAYRDLNALDQQVGVPLWQRGGKWGIVDGYFLPPVQFSLPEAMNVFLASRLMLNYSRKYDPTVASTFFKLNSIVPPPLREQIQGTIEWLQKQRNDEPYQHIMRTLVEAWMRRRTVRIKYHTLGDAEATERNIDTYFIEPAAAAHSSYVIARCHRTAEVRIFKIERIEAIETKGEEYLIPPDFDANAFLAASWGIVAGGETETIKLKFAPDVATILEEVIWHPSQVTKRQPDGCVLMTLNVVDTVELRSWILGWGDKVKVLAPKKLSEGIIKSARGLLHNYGRR